MGIKLFSSSSFDRKPERVTEYVTLPNPDPSNYKILEWMSYANGYLIVKIKYPDCTNYEGKKILVFKNCSLTDLKKQRKIDPHFSKNKKMFSPVARFEPTDEGWENAQKFVSLF
jgi:hypothetical protein